jgi:sodium/proline symporter
VLPEGPDDDVALLIARVRPGGHADRTASWAVDTAPTALAAARQLAVDQVTAWDVPDGLRFDVALIVSELTTNALRHGTPPVTLKLRKSGMRLFIEVQDHGAGSPQRRYAAPTDEHGRGLQLVATLSRRWGTRHTADGKTVWCELAL